MSIFKFENFTTEWKRTKMKEFDEARKNISNLATLKDITSLLAQLPKQAWKFARQRIYCFKWCIVSDGLSRIINNINKQTTLPNQLLLFLLLLIHLQCSFNIILPQVRLGGIICNWPRLTDLQIPNNLSNHLDLETDLPQCSQFP
jgi:hypothetical protein